MKKRYRLSKPARQDIDEIWLYLAQQSSVETADRFVWRIHEKIVNLAMAPGIGRKCEEVAPGS